MQVMWCVDDKIGPALSRPMVLSGYALLTDAYDGVVNSNNAMKSRNGLDVGAMDAHRNGCRSRSQDALINSTNDSGSKTLQCTSMYSASLLCANW